MDITLVGKELRAEGPPDHWVIFTNRVPAQGVKKCYLAGPPQGYAGVLFRYPTAALSLI